MISHNPSQLFDNVESVIVEPLKFKAKLAIGEDAYVSLRLKNKVFEAWDILGVTTTAAAIAKSSAVASTFFAPTGLLATIGIGGVAATPIGWVIAASVVTGGAWVGVTRFLKKHSKNRVTVIPNFINTPMDVLALGLFNLIAPLALKIAIIDENIAEPEKVFISDYFIKEWGYDKSFVTDGLAATESKLSEFSIRHIAISLAEFQKNNPDCNYNEMSKEIISFLKGIMESDGKIDEREEIAIEKTEHIFREIGKFNIKAKSTSCLKSIMRT